nr:hypothetical protein [Tanacetum cinerariifolium]
MMKGSDVGIQDNKAKLFNEWEKFTSTDRESIESYYYHISKLRNNFKRNKNFPEKITSNLKFLNNIQPEWRRHVTIVHQTKYLHELDYTRLYDFLKYNQVEVNELRAERLAKAYDPLALMANSNNRYNYLVFHQDQPSPVTYMQQPQPNNKWARVGDRLVVPYGKTFSSKVTCLDMMTLLVVRSRHRKPQCWEG